MGFGLIFLLFVINTLTIIKSDSHSVHYNGEILNINLRKIQSLLTQQPINLKKFDLFKSKENVTKNEKNIETDFILNLNKNEFCKVLNTKLLEEEFVEKLIWMIKRKYYYKFFLDNLPSARGFLQENLKENSIDYSRGIPLGYEIKGNNENEEKERNHYYIYNHFIFKVSLHEVTLKNDSKGYEIVGFTTYPASIQQNENNLGCADYNNKSSHEIPKLNESFLPQHIKANEKITFTYDVIFEKSNLTLSMRLDNYTNSKHYEKIHWLGIIISNLIIFIFSYLVKIILNRTLKQDIDVYNVKVIEDEFIDDSGWKQVCNDVFRKPVHPMLFASMAGNGIHIFFIIFFSLLLLMILILFNKTESNGEIALTMFIFSILFSCVGGYISGRLYKYFKGQNWKKNAYLTAFFYPSIIFLIFVIINFLFFLEGTEHTNFMEVIIIMVVWIVFSSPLTLIGAFFGTKTKSTKIPCRVNPCPTFIPDKPWYFRMRYLIWVTGLIPYMAVFIEFSLFMASIWEDRFGYIFTFLLISIIVLIIVSAEVSIITVYLCLCKGDYRWWWKSFCFGGSSAIYIMLYIIYYFFAYLDITRFTSIVYYFGSMAILSSTIFLLCGSCSVLITTKFLFKIYSMIKVD